MNLFVRCLIGALIGAILGIILAKVNMFLGRLQFKRMVKRAHENGELS